MTRNDYGGDSFLKEAKEVADGEVLTLTVEEYVYFKKSKNKSYTKTHVLAIIWDIKIFIF